MLSKQDPKSAAAPSDLINPFFATRARIIIVSCLQDEVQSQSRLLTTFFHR